MNYKKTAKKDPKGTANKSGSREDKAFMRGYKAGITDSADKIEQLRRDSGLFIDTRR
jgi:hypothetical protein